MKSKRFGALAVALISLLALILGLRLAVGSQADASAKGGLLLLEPLDVAAVTPNSAPNDLDTPIVISGTGFTAVLSGAQVITPPSVFLGNVPLPEVTWVSSTQLLSVVPWGMDPASYPLTVANPDGMTDSLSGAFTVTQGIGVWTTDGPYGGSVRDLAVRQTDPSTVFAVVSMAGLYQSRDGGGHWERTGLGPGIGFEQIAYGLASPNTLCACGVAGLWQSPDHGQTWSAIVEGTSLMAFAQHPTDSSILYVSRWDTGIFRSGDGGQTWESRSQGIDLLRVRRIVIDPEAPATLYAATDEYGVYKSTDEGLTWAVADFGLADDPDDNAYRLAINPFSTDNLWAAGVYGGHLFRSDDGAESWVTVPITYPVQRALTFSPVVSGTL